VQFLKAGHIHRNEWAEIATGAEVGGKKEMSMWHQSIINGVIDRDLMSELEHE
jgi:hypothetical protein